MTINGIPVHPLAVHAAVVFAPLAGLLALAYLVPTWRDRLRWPLLAVGVAAAFFVWFAAFTGGNLEESHRMQQAMSANPRLREAVHDHEDLAGKLQVAAYVLAGLCVGVWWFHARPGWARTALLVLVPLGGIAILVLAVMTGDAGAKAVWTA